MLLGSVSFLFLNNYGWIIGGWGQVPRVDHRKQAIANAHEDPFPPQLKQRLSDPVVEGEGVFSFPKINDAAGIKFILVRGPSIGEGLENKPCPGP
jgi:hypothetical protein